jgi:hypothetical protein
MLIARRHTAVADSHASRPCPPSLAHSVGGCPRRDHRAISASSCGSGVGSGSSTRIGQLPVLSLEVLLGLRAGGAVVRVHTRECTSNDRKRYEQKITSFGTLDHQCSRWHPIASVIDRLRYTPGRGRRGHCFRDARCNASRVTRQCLALLRSRYSPRVRIGYGPTRVQHPEAQHDALEAARCERIFIDHASGKLATRPELAGQGAAGRRTRRRPARRRQARPARPLARASDREIAADFGVTRDRVPRTEEDRDGCRSPRLRAGRRLERAPTAGWAHWRRATQRRSAAKAAIAPTLDDRVVADSIVSSATTWPSKR